jgi:hypothetical protein
VDVVHIVLVAEVQSGVWATVIVVGVQVEREVVGGFGTGKIGGEGEVGGVMESEILGGREGTGRIGVVTCCELLDGTGIGGTDEMVEVGETSCEWMESTEIGGMGKYGVMTSCEILENTGIGGTGKIGVVVGCSTSETTGVGGTSRVVGSVVLEGGILVSVAVVVI